MIIINYIDPGTGSMLFTIFIGIVTSLLFLWKKLVIKLKFMLYGGRAEATEERYPYVIFCENKRYWNVFRSVCREFEKREIPVEYLTESEDDPAFSEDFKYVHCRFIGENNKAYARLNLLNADVLLSTTPGLDVYQWKRSQNVGWYVHIFHTIDEACVYRMFGMDYYDAILLTGAFQEKYIRKLEQLRGLPSKELPVVGSTYMDELKEKLEQAQAKGETGKEDKTKTVLLAPSWGESSIFARYGEKILRALTATGYQIIVRPHPQSVTSEKEILEPLQKEFPDSEQLSWNYDNNNFEVLRKADVLISDFSGVVFDYVLAFGKPVIYADTSFDPAPYDAAWIEEPLWRFEVLKEFGTLLTEDDFPNMKGLIDKLLKSDQKKDAIDRVRAESWQYIGESAARTVDYMVKKRQDLLAERA